MCCFLLSSQHKTSSVSVVFVFNASLIDVAPLSPILFPDNMRREGKLFVNAICVVSFLSSPRRSSIMSVLFFFKAFPNADAPTSPISSSCVLMKREKEWIVEEHYLNAFFIVLTIQTEFCECCV